MVGSLEPGKRADIVIRSADVAELMPSVDPVHQLVAVGHGPTADTVLVNGRLVLQHGHATLIDEAAIFSKAQKSVAGILARLGMNRQDFGRGVRPLNAEVIGQRIVSSEEGISAHDRKVIRL